MGKRFELLISDAEAHGSGSHGELALIRDLNCCFLVRERMVVGFMESWH